VAVDAVLAGADILLMPPDEKAAIDAVVAAVGRGQIPEERIDHSVRRVLAAKAAVGLLQGRRADMGLVLTRVGRGDHEAWAREAAERSITAVRAEAGSLPIRVRDRSVVVVIYDDRRNHDSGGELEAALAERGARVTAVRLTKASGPDALERARRLASTADVTLFASFSRALPWKGALGLPGEVAALARWLAESGTPVISFGDPYLLRQLPTVRNYLIAWSEAGVSQRAAVRGLVGEMPITGTLPIDLPEGYGVGQGVLVPSLPGITVLRNP
jgi:beta-N-acetylhexosaminidase